MSNERFVIAAGHPGTAAAAEEILRDGGNAYDAVVAALWAACSCEPVLTSPGGGGFLMAVPAAGPPRVFDFFVQSPSTPRPADELEFYVANAEFGEATQAFHIGLGAMPVPGPHMMMGAWSLSVRWKCGAL